MFVGVVLLTIAVFVIGENRNMWDPKMTYQSAFSDVAGLKPGSPVRMGGVDIGSVVSVGYLNSAGDSRIYVKMSIVKAEAERIRTTTVARVVNKGLLGDKMVELTTTQGGAPPLDPSELILSEEPIDLQTYIAKFDALAQKAEKVIDNIEKGTRAFGEPKFGEDVRVILGSARDVIDAVAHGEGPIHRAIFDVEMGKSLNSSLKNLAATTAEAQGLVADLHQVSTQVRKGPGAAHVLLYDETMGNSMRSLVGEVEKDLIAVREGNGLAHSIIYGDNASDHLMANVRSIGDNVQKIVADVRAGKGTIGGLLVDPSIYEDIKAVVGNIDRNQVLRALVRYSIRAEEERATRESTRAK